MAIQIYLVHPKDNTDDNARAVIADSIVSCQGFIMMASTHGSLIAAFDEQYLAAIKSHHMVDFVGGVTLDPNSPGSDALRQLFARNVAMQLASNGAASSSGNSDQANFPPGYRPLRWPTREEDGNS